MRLNFISTDKVIKIESLQLKPRGFRGIEDIHRPIIPEGNTCCKGVCEIVNDYVKDATRDIRIAQQELNTLPPGKLSAKTRKGMNVRLANITAIKDIRMEMLENDICKCIDITRSEKIKLPTTPKNIIDTKKVTGIVNKKKSQSSLIFL